MVEFTLQEIASAVGGRIINISDKPNDAIHVRGVCTDSRSVQSENLFVALIGERFDGHQFCRDVAARGVCVFIISQEDALPIHCVGILAQDTLRAYQDLARYYRTRLGCKVIAVTGSVGKTSTREMIATALGSSRKTHVTADNNNNEIGLPSTILSAPEDTQVMVLEMGMRQRGEIRLLTTLAEPDIAVVTNIGFSHIERLGSREEILAAKMEICEGLDPDGVLIINGDDTLLTGYVSVPENVLWGKIGEASWNPASCRKTSSTYCVHSDHIVMSETGTSFEAVLVREDRTEYRIGIELESTGRHHIKNAMFSLLCAAFIGVDLIEVADAIKNFHPIVGRGKIIHTKHFTVVDDAYNASPESMAAAFESIGVLAGERRKIAAIGGMLELGKFAPELHRQVGINAAEFGIDGLYVCGDYAHNVRDGALSVRPDMPVYVFENTAALVNAILRELMPGDVILTKASHAYGFDWVAKEIIRNDGGPAPAEKEGT